MGTDIMEHSPSQIEIENTYRSVATEVGGKVVDIIEETATRLSISVGEVQGVVCRLLQKGPDELDKLWIPSEIDR